MGRWAPIYDLVFGKVFDHGRQSTIAEADKIGGRVLDVRRRYRAVPVGLFAQHQTMRRRYFRADAAPCAAARARAGLTNVEMACGDGRQEIWRFRMRIFDAVVAQYVITAVPDPEAHAG
jgi:phosphatidylethanolamine/phosphatidyl-N-methylethanolamine N-methyltransferase